MIKRIGVFANPQTVDKLLGTCSLFKISEN